MLIIMLEQNDESAEKSKSSERFRFLQAGLDLGKGSGEKQSRDEPQKAGKWKLRKNWK